MHKSLRVSGRILRSMWPVYCRGFFFGWGRVGGRIQCVILFFFWEGGGVPQMEQPPLPPPQPVSEQTSATSPCCVFLKTNERLTL